MDRRALWAGRVLTALPVLTMLVSAAFKLMRSPEVVAAWTGSAGYPESTLVPIAIVEIACAVIYAIPRTAVLGAILVTGYLGGAIATHVRVGDAFLIPLALGVLAWAGIFLRCARLRAILPLR